MGSLAGCFFFFFWELSEGGLGFVWGDLFGDLVVFLFFLGVGGEFGMFFFFFFGGVLGGMNLGGGGGWKAHKSNIIPKTTETPLCQRKR